MTVYDDQQPDDWDQLRREAYYWHVRMRGEDADEHREAWKKWLKLGAVHLGAYNRAAERYNAGKFLIDATGLKRLTPEEFASLAGTDPAEPVDEPADHMETVDETEPASPTPAPYGTQRSRSRVLLGACVTLAIAMMVTLGIIAVHGQGGARRSEPSHLADGIRMPAELATLADEVRRETLPDGSVVTLQPNTILTFTFGTEHRWLRLKRGRARFDVAHESRPFSVSAGGGIVLARGTIFDVGITAAHKVVVKLLRGAVDVTRPASPMASNARPPKPLRLTPGKELVFDVAVPTGGTRVPAVVAPIQQKRGGSPEMMRFVEASLAEVAAQASIRGRIQVRLGDPALGKLHVSGRFPIDDPKRLADDLAVAFDLKIVNGKDGALILQPK